MAKFCGKDFLFQIEDSSSPGTYISITQIRDNSFTLNGEQVDITDKSSSGWRELLESCGINSMSLSGSGVFSDSAYVAGLMQHKIDNTHVNLRVISGLGDQFEGAFEVASFGRSGTYNDAETFDVSIESAGEITYTPAP